MEKKIRKEYNDKFSKLTVGLTAEGFSTALAFWDNELEKLIERRIKNKSKKEDDLRLRIILENRKKIEDFGRRPGFSDSFA